MLPQHVFSHQHQYADQTWQYQQPPQSIQQQSSHQQQLSSRNGANTSASDANAFMSAVGPNTHESQDERRILEWIAQLMSPATRETALLELSKKREQFPQLALILWHSFGVMTSLLQEIISVYPLLNPSQLTAAASNRVCNALALLQCVASHNETRGLFLSGK